MIAVLGSACATVDGTSDEGLDEIVVRKGLLGGGEYGVFVDRVGMDLLEDRFVRTYLGAR